MVQDIISNAEEIVVSLLFLLVIIHLILLFTQPIKSNRVLVTNKFSYQVLGFVALSFLAIFLLTLRIPSNSVTQSEPSANSAWSHLFSPGISISGNEHVVFYRLLDILGVLIFNVFLITTLINYLSRLREKWKDGKIYYNKSLYGRKCNNNVVVLLGNHDSSFGIVKQCLDRTDNKPDYVLVLIDSNVDEYRSRLLSVISKENNKKVILCRGSLTSGLDLRNIHIEKAREVFILGNNISDSSNFSTHDAECIKCIRLLRDNGIVTALTRPKQLPPLMCRVFFEYQTSYAVFQTADIGGEETRPIDGENTKFLRVLVFKPMNFYELFCEKVIASPNPTSEYYIPIDGKEGINETSEAFVHMIIVGHTQMGTALGIETAHLAHFPNFHKTENGKRIGPRTRISFIDEHADIEKDYFMGRLKELFELSPWNYIDMSANSGQVNWIHPMEDKSSPYYDGHIGKDFIDVEWEFVKGNIVSSRVREYLLSSVREENAKCTVAICFHDQNLSVAATQYLPDEVCKKAQEILVYQSREGSVIDEMVKYDLSGRFTNVRSFGTLGKSFDDQFCAKIESHFDADLKLVDTSKNKTKSQIACWWSDRYRELTTWIKLRSFGLDYSNVNIELFSKVEHSRWNMEQLLLGYRPLTIEEQESVLSVSAENADCEKTLKQCIKDDLKSKKAHLDICSCEKLTEVDPYVIEYDTPSYQYTIKTIYGEFYQPRPIDTVNIQVPDDITQLSEQLAIKVHNVWMNNRMKEGWKYGKKRSAVRKKHPGLVSYEALPESEKEYDRNTSMETLKVILSLGYSIVKNEGCSVNTLSEDVIKLSELLAKNAHEVWANGRIKEGWSFGEVRDESNKKDPCILPYELLPDSEKEYDRKTSMEAIRHIRSMGYSITKTTSL